MRKHIFACSLAALTMGTLPAAAQEPATLTYQQFEVSVPHTDLAACPDSMAQGGVFCRATLNYEEIHVFAFSDSGDSPFVAFQSFPAEDLITLLP